MSVRVYVCEYVSIRVCASVCACLFLCVYSGLLIILHSCELSLVELACAHMWLMDHDGAERLLVGGSCSSNVA